MNKNRDYRLINIRNRALKLREERHAILACDDENALNMILESKAPATLVQSFPDQDLYYLMHKIGPYDFIPVLAMASSSQWEYILDVEVWESDRLNITYMTKIFDILFKADSKRLLRWSIKEKPDFFEFYLFKNIVVKVREHDELPPADFDDYITIDDKFYFRFPGKAEKSDSEESESSDNNEAPELIETMLKTVAGMDLSVFHGILLETESILPSEVEEEQYRLKNVRLAEKGFLPPHEAIGIYQPAKVDDFRERTDISALKEQEYDPEIPLPPQFFSPFLKEDNLFVKSLNLCDQRMGLTFESELAALINKVISADKVKLTKKEDLEKVISKTCDYINLGLEIILKGERKPELARDVIIKYFLEDIFRTGSRAGIKLKTKAVNWFKQSFMNKNNLPLSFLDEKFLGVIGGLFLSRPLYFDNYASGRLYRNFAALSDIKDTGKKLDKIIALDSTLEKMQIDVKSFTHGVLTYKSMLLTLWAREKLSLPSNLEAIDTAVFKKFFQALFIKKDIQTDFQVIDNIQLNDLIMWTARRSAVGEKDLSEALLEILHDLMDELDEEYATVDHEKINPRFIPHFLLK